MSKIFNKGILTCAQWESFHCEVVRGSSYHAMWHFHPEYQLTLVLESHGHRMLGDNITPLRPGDLVLVGANLPHVWHEKPGRRGARDKVHAIVARFLDTFLGCEFLERPGMESVRQLLRRAARGLQVTGKTREAHLSPGTFSRFFKLRAGKTLPESVNALRIGRACGSLAEGNGKVTDIAMDCGFRNLANFNRRFRVLTKLSPREYRSRFRETAG
jgi:AraC-like DNA-binding protein